MYRHSFPSSFDKVATVLTVYGIETKKDVFIMKPPIKVATALTVYGIETLIIDQ